MALLESIIDLGNAIICRLKNISAMGICLKKLHISCEPFLHGDTNTTPRRVEKAADLRVRTVAIIIWVWATSPFGCILLLCDVLEKFHLPVRESWSSWSENGECVREGNGYTKSL